MTKVLRVVKNEEDGIQTEITEFYKGGYGVGLRDTDCGERLPTTKIFPKWEDAVAAAEAWAHGRQVR